MNSTDVTPHDNNATEIITPETAEGSSVLVIIMGAGLVIVLIGLIVSILAQLGKIRLPSGGKTCRKCCSKIRKKKKTPY